MGQPPELWFFICAAIVAASALMQAIFMMVIAIGAMKTRKRIDALTERIENDVMPAVQSVRGLVEDATPKLKQATDHVLEISRTAREQVDHVSETLSDIVDKTHTQANRVDECLTTTLDVVGRATGSVHRATGGTSRKMNAILTGIRVGVAVLGSRKKGK